MAFFFFFQLEYFFFQLLAIVFPVKKILILTGRQRYSMCILNSNFIILYTFMTLVGSNDINHVPVI